MTRFVVLGSANGSGNHGDAVMWEVAVQELRAAVGADARVVTDGAPSWQPQFSGVSVLPHLVWDLMGTDRITRLATRATLKRTPLPLELVRRRARSFASGQLATPLAERWMERLNGSEALVFSGAGAITSVYPAHGILSWWALSQYAKSIGKPVIFLGQGVGPFDRRPAWAKDLALEMLDTADFVGVRESESHELLRAEGVESVLAPDWAFGASASPQDQAWAAQRLKAHQPSQTEQPVLGVAVHRTTRSTPALDTRVIAMCSEAMAKGWRLLLVPNMVGGGTWDDRKYLSRLQQRLDGADLVVEDTTPGESRALLGACDGVITTRYHGLIFALSQKRPTLALAVDAYYRQKLYGATHWFGLDNTNVSRLEDRARSEEVLSQLLDRSLPSPSDDDIQGVRSKLSTTMANALTSAGTHCLPRS